MNEPERSPADLREALRETLASPGWVQVIQPALEDRLATLRAALEDGFTKSIEEIRALQWQISLLRELVERPMEGFEP